MQYPSYVFAETLRDGTAVTVRAAGANDERSIWGGRPRGPGDAKDAITYCREVRRVIRIAFGLPV